MKTFSQKPADVSREWVVLDAATAPLGRLASVAAKRLIGKHKSTYTPHVDGGDYVVVINADQLVLTGNKLDTKTYYRHSGFPGGIKSRTAAEQKALDSTKMIADAVRGMLPKNKLLDERLARLKVFAGAEHAHSAQSPKAIEVKG